MTKYRILLNKKILLETNSLYKAIIIISKNYNDENYILQQDYDNHWDEWLDQDGLNAHEHLHSYDNKISHLEDDDDDDDDNEDKKDIDMSTYEDEDEQENGLSQKESIMKHLSEEEIVEDNRFINIIVEDHDKKGPLDEEDEEKQHLNNFFDNLDNEEIENENEKIKNDEEKQHLNDFFDNLENEEIDKEDNYQEIKKDEEEI